MIIFVAGARPNYIKVQPLIDKCREKGMDYLVFNANQHQENMQVFKMGEIKERPKINRASRFAKTIDGFTHFLLDSFDSHFIKWVVVVGDTDTSLACALTADMLGYEVAHVEAGMRSFYKMPEEVNRIAIDRLSTIRFAPTQTCVKNLENEKMHSILVGNIMIESLLKYGYLEKMNIPPYVLMEIHRQENDCNQQELFDIVAEFPLRVLWVKHPRNTYPEKAKNIEFLEPMTYAAMTNLTANATLVITDSGGLQCDATYLKVPCVTLRENTEWVETLGHGNTIAKRVGQLEGVCQRAPIMFDYDFASELWDDKVSERILEYLV